MTELEQKNNQILSDYWSQRETDLKPILEKLDLDAFLEMVSVYGFKGFKAIISDRIKSGEFDLVKFVDEYKGGKDI